MSAPDRKFSHFQATLASAGGAPSGSGSHSETISDSSGAVPLLAPGTVLAGRYEVLAVLGQGGMGAVYKAHDRELDRTVALKTIRPEMAASAAMLARFKQEVLLASQITHPNVIRLYDLSEAAGMKFITMEFIEGDDLRASLLAKGKMPPAESVAIIRQVCLALEAAHAKGVIHRDLKPQNVMLEKSGRVVVMDFGLARSLSADGMTQTGALMGTMEYMSPEQAMAGEVDQRSDIFAVGLIFFELLTGKMPYKADTALASLLKRSRERASAASDIDNTVPRPLSNVVSRCLERDRENRYADVGQLLADLESVQASGKVSARVIHFRRPTIPTAVYKWISVALLAMVVAAGTFVVWKKKTSAPAATVLHAPVSVLVADFSNNTGDPVFDDTLEPMFNVALEGASFVNAFSRGQARKLAGKLPQGSDKLDEATARRVALGQSLGAVVTGSLSRSGSGYKLSVKALDAVSGKIIGTAEVNAANKDDVLLAVPRLAAPIRRALGDTTPESVQLAASAGAFTVSSLEAVHEYGVGMEQQFAGKMQDALKSFSEAAKLDPNFARAYAGMAAVSGNLGQMQQANEYAKQAMEHVDRMTERERYRIRGLYYIRNENWQQCVEEYSELVKQYPADNIAYNNLAGCNAKLHNLSAAEAEVKQALQVSPKDMLARMNLSFYASLAGDFQTSESEAREVLQLNPAYEQAFLVLAYAQLGQGELPQATDTYLKVEKTSARGASLSAAGLANLALYEGRLTEAIQILDKAAAADLKAKSPDTAAQKLIMLAHAELMRGDERAALAAANRALANSKEMSVRFLAARMLIAARQPAKARELAAGFGSELESEPHAYAKLIEAEIALQKGDAQQAVATINDANKIVDTWIGHFDLGRAYLQAGAYAQADSEFERCLKRRGEAMEFFMDDMPTYSYVPAVYYYDGRALDGLKSPGAADSYRAYVNIRGKAGEDPLLPEIRRRLGQ